MKLKSLLFCCLLSVSSMAANADSGKAVTPASVAAKLSLRGEANDVVVPEMRLVRRNDILVVQADLTNTNDSNRTVFYRFRWLDNSGSPVGDGESWKQIPVMGRAVQTVKSVAPHASATDFRLEMNVEKQ